jgi:hypothetical protein
MLHEHELKVRIVERRGRLYQAGHALFNNELDLFMAWIDSEPYLAGMLREIEAADVEFADWRGSTRQGFDLKFPADERARAKVCLEAARSGNATALGREFGDGSSFDENNRSFMELFVSPLVHYLEDRLADGGSVLGILQRYKRRTEWFHQADLFGRYHADTTRGEDTLDAHLREYLVDQGVPFPFPQVHSPSGRADAIAGVGGDDPLPLEIKLFLPEAGKDQSHLRQGFVQAYRYAADFGATVAYLVCFNLTAGTLGFESDGDRSHWPSQIRLGDRVIFLIDIDANPERPSASQMPASARHLISRDYMLAGINGEQ